MERMVVPGAQLVLRQSEWGPPPTPGGQSGCLPPPPPGHCVQPGQHSRPHTVGVAPSPPPHLAIACSLAEMCLEWNMSQSGCTSTDMKRPLNAQAARWGWLEAGSRG